MIKVLLVLGTVLFLAACGEKTSIPSGEVGKVMDNGGLEQDVRPPGTFRMAFCGTGACPKLVRLQVFENTTEVPSEIYVPKSDQVLGFTVAVQYSIKNDINSINRVFQRVRAVPINNVAGQVQTDESNRVLLISTEAVFNTYVKPRLPDTIRAALSNYSIEEIMANFTEVRNYVEQKVVESLQNTPINVVNVTFTEVRWPEILLEAKDKAAAVDSRKLQQIRQLEADLEVERMKRELLILRAKNAKEAAEIIADDMSPEMATFMMLDAMSLAAENGVPVTIHPSMFPHAALEMRK